MPMTVMNNNAAAMALGELNKNNTELAKDLQKVSSGKRIYGAANGASEYSIGKNMEVLIRSLGQDIINTQTGRDLIKTAEGGIQEIVDIIRNMKEMALNSANDHNTNLDRATLQKEFNQRIYQISDIAATTNYNGRLLLNGDYLEGSWGEKEETITDISETTVPKPTIPTTNPLVDEPTGAVTIINAGNYTISTDGVYMLAPNYQGTITVNAGNVELCSSSGVTNKAAYINCPNSNTNLWLNDLRVDNSQFSQTVDKSVIRFSGTGNTLNLIGSSQLWGQGKNTALVNTGKELTIYEGAFNGSLRMERTTLKSSKTHIYNAPDVEIYDTYGAILGSDGGENNDGALIINGGEVLVGGSHGADLTGATYVGNKGACIGSGANSTFGSITVNGGYVIAAYPGLMGACVGTGFNGTISGDIIVIGGNLHASNFTNPRDSENRYRIPFSAATIGCGIGGNIIGGINVIGGVITATNRFCGAGIGTAGDDKYMSSIGYINIDTLSFDANSRAGEAIGKGASPSDPACYIYDSTYPYSYGHEDIPVDVNSLTGTVGDISIKEGAIYSWDGNNTNKKSWLYDGEIKYHHVGRGISQEDIEKEKENSEGSGKIVNVSYYTNRYETYQEGRPLIIHTGPKANLNLQVFINSMHPIAMGLVGISVNPRENAVKSLEKLDNALEYALKEQTKMGAYQMRLSQTEETLIAEHENTISAESVLTDADMAKEMSEFTKHSVLSQAAQSMLAQEQKNAGAVLDMLK